MKNLLIVLFAIYMLSHFMGCSTSTLYMSHNEIVEKMEEVSEVKKEKGDRDPDERRRMANLIPLEDLFGDDFGEITKKKKQKTILMKSDFLEKNRIGADHRNRDTPVKRQWNGTCTTFGGVAGIENLLNQPTYVDLSERDTWAKYEKYSCRAFVDALSKDGNEICREVDWGQNNTYPSSTCKDNRKWRLGHSKYIKDNIEAALDALDRGSVVYLGMSTPRDMLSCRSVIRTSSSFIDGGHAILIVGYKIDASIKGGGYFIIKNSWGNSCGDLGYQYLPFYLCQKSGGYCIMWEFRTVVDKSNCVPPTTFPDPEYTWVEKCKRKWYWLWLKKKCYWVKVKK